MHKLVIPEEFGAVSYLLSCMQTRQGFGSSEFARRGAACKIIDKLNPAGGGMYVNFLFVFPRVARSGVAPVPSLWW